MLKICDVSVLSATHDETATLLTARDDSVTLVISREPSCEPEQQKERLVSPPQPSVPYLLSTALPNDIRVKAGTSPTTVSGGSTTVGSGNASDAVSSLFSFHDESNKPLDAKSFPSPRRIDALFEASSVPVAVGTNNNNIVSSKDAFLVTPASVVPVAARTQSSSLIPDDGVSPSIVDSSAIPSPASSSGVDSLFASLEKMSPSVGGVGQAQPVDVSSGLSGSSRFPPRSPQGVRTMADDKRKDSVSN